MSEEINNLEPDVTVEQLEEIESKIFAEFQRVFHSHARLSSEIAKTHKALGEALSLNAAEHLTAHQRTSFLWLLSSLNHQFLMGALCIMRGHPTDATGFARKSIEITSFMLEVLSEEESAKRWMEIGTSSGARERYKSRFSAFKLVQKHLRERDKQLYDAYEEYCLMVHPGLASVSHQAELESGVFSFNHVEFSNQAHLDHVVMQYLVALTLHLRMCNVLSTMCEQNKLILSAAYYEQYSKAVELVERSNHGFVQEFQNRQRENT